MTAIRFEEATARHARLVAQSMRERDVAEVRAGWGLPPLEAIRTAMGQSYYARTCFYGLEPLAVYGLAALAVLGGTARVWIFATSAVDAHPLAFARASLKALADLHEQASLITNLIDLSDKAACKWLDWLGGTYVLQPQPRGGRLFGQFILARERPTRDRKCLQG
jgi:hypothetical protein